LRIRDFVKIYGPKPDGLPFRRRPILNEPKLQMRPSYRNIVSGSNLQTFQDLEAYLLFSGCSRSTLGCRQGVQNILRCHLIPVARVLPNSQPLDVYHTFGLSFVKASSTRWAGNSLLSTMPASLHNALIIESRIFSVFISRSPRRQYLRKICSTVIWPKATDTARVS